MAHRLSGLHVSLGLSLLFFAGCQGGNPSAPIPAKPAAGAQAVPAANPIVAAGTSSEQATPAVKPPIEITPGSSTITADDPGLQLLAARNDAGSIRDLTTDVKWSLEPPGLAEIEQGGYVRPV